MREDRRTRRRLIGADGNAQPFSSPPAPEIPEKHLGGICGACGASSQVVRFDTGGPAELCARCSREWGGTLASHRLDVLALVRAGLSWEEARSAIYGRCLVCGATGERGTIP